jgi:murein L,D-transpeptidase YafK
MPAVPGAARSVPMDHLTVRAASILVVAALVPLAGCFSGGATVAAYAPIQRPLYGADRIVVHKSEHLLEVWGGNTLLDSFPIALGFHPEGPKQQEGDGRTPQGVYVIDWRSADTKYYRELHISYPDARDLAQAQAMHVDPGGEIFIHGLPPGFGDYDPRRFPRDWTDGCIAVSDNAMETLWNAVPDGTPIDILP